MTSFGAFQTSVLGMVSQSHALGVIGANIANVTTGGFKRTDAQLPELFRRLQARGFTRMVQISAPPPPCTMISGTANCGENCTTSLAGPQ